MFPSLQYSTEAVTVYINIFNTFKHDLIYKQKASCKKVLSATCCCRITLHLTSLIVS